MTATMAAEFLFGAGSQADKVVMIANLAYAASRRHPGTRQTVSFATHPCRDTR